ncbi:MAG: Calx-beta domain-containing protein [Planctomycetaceae bacterium]
MKMSRRVRRHQQGSIGQIELLEDRSLLSATVPEFSSLPGADHTIFLDFDGHTVTGTGWNGYYNQAELNAPAFDINDDPENFNATELGRIEESWARMAEDFRPFKVNVTTVEPSIDALKKDNASDSQWGLRVIVTQERQMVDDPDEYCRCGGIAYINSFNSSIDLPVWVYTSGGKSIAEAGSHEVGHALGLSHDGLTNGDDRDTPYYRGHDGPSGETGWASIMGVGYYQNVSQWDRGEYFDSNNANEPSDEERGANYGSGPDDLAIISDVDRNGFGYRTDDAGDSNAAAAPLGVTGTEVDTTGLIETTADVDVYRFTTGSGLVTLDVAPFSVGDNNNGANLDVGLALYDGEGTLVAASNPVETLDASIELELEAGEYFLQVEGVGVGDPANDPPSGYSDYASIGQYTITGTVVEPADRPTLSVSDVTVDEGSGTASVTVTLSGTVDDIVSVDFATGDDTAEAPSDYEETSGGLTFLEAGSQTITVNINDDSEVELTEEFFVTLSDAENADITNGEATVSITDNDIGVEIAGYASTEGNATRRSRRRRGVPELKNFTFEVNLTTPSTETVTVDFETVNVTASSRRRDFYATSGTVVFEPGETTQNIVVVVIGDNRRELDETFEVRLSDPSNAVLQDTRAVGTILDDDGTGRGQGDGMIVDPLWYFEGPGSHDHNHSHEHDHDHHDHDHEHHSGHHDHETDDHECNCDLCSGKHVAPEITDVVFDTPVIGVDSPDLFSDDDEVMQQSQPAESAPKETPAVSPESPESRSTTLTPISYEVTNDPAFTELDLSVEFNLL